MSAELIPYTPPSYGAGAFNCPNCNAFANQVWGGGLRVTGGAAHGVQDLQIAVCMYCNKVSLWMANSIVYPAHSPAPLPNPDLPPDILVDYNEARDIVQRSPRGAAALLRLAIQKLCEHVGESSDNLNKAIGNLVKKGLQPRVQQALDVVRVIGNNAVHPGQIDLIDDVQTATALFSLVNLITQQMITDPNEAQAIFDTLPEPQRDQITKRDNTK